MKNYKIYTLKNPITNEIRYIGVTTAKYLSIRLSQHWYNANHNKQTHVSKWIRHIKCKPIIELLEECNENNWEDREKYWIKTLPRLTNHHEGGKGVVTNRDNNSIQKSAQAHEVKIVQLDENGDLLKIWDSLKEASTFYKAKSISSISNVLTKRAKRAFGYRWFYYDDYINDNHVIEKLKPSVNYDNIQKVYLYDSEDNFIKEYLSLNQLSKDLKCAYTSARKALKNNKLLFKKYKIQNYMI